MKIRVDRCAVTVRGALLVTLLAIAASPSALAQAVAVAEVGGYVSDPSGRAIAGAQVSMTETDKQQVRTTATDARGRYSLPGLPVGSYQLIVKADGFRAYVQSGIILQAANNVEVNVTLKLGAVSERVEVTANTSMVETRDSSIAEVVDQARVVELPLNGRNPTQLIVLTGGATATTTADLTTSKNMGGSNGSGTFSVAGSQGNGLNYLLDGGDNNDALTNVNLPLPFPDAIQEFSVQTSALLAQYGLHPGGVVNAITKSGSNDFHGALFEFLRNGDFNARQSGTPARDSLKRSQFGGVAGGRIIRDKLFFFGGYQGTEQRSNPPTQISYVPTSVALNGDFNILETPQSAGGCLSVSKGRLLTDPSNGQPFPGNQIPVSRFNQQALTLAAKYLPQATNQCGLVQYGLPANNPDNQWIGRVDYILTSKHSLYGRYYVYDYTAETTFNGSNLLTTSAPGNHERSQTLTLGDTYTFGPTTLNSFHATFTRRRDDRGAPPNDINPTTLGSNVYSLIPNFIYLSVSNYFNVGCGTCSPSYFNVNSFQVSDDLSIIKGKHQLSFGGDVRRLQANLLTNTYTNGDFSFNGSFTGDALADFLLGNVFTNTQANPQPDALRQTVFALYAQDTIRLSRRLTLNLGVRWEPSQFPYDLYGRAIQFSLASFEAGQHSAVYPNAPAGLIFPRDSANPYGKSMTMQHWLTMSPRLGLVWDPAGDGKQTIRVAASLMHDTDMIYYPERWTYSPPYGTQISQTSVNFSSPWSGYPGGNPFPAVGVFPPAGIYYVVPQNLKPTYMTQWNVNYQRQLGGQWLAKVAYLGNKTTHIWGDTDVNPSVYIPGSSAATNSRRVLYLQNPSQGQSYAGIFQGVSNLDASYEALTASVEHRFANNFTVLSNYAWSHCISDYDVVEVIASPDFENPNNPGMDRGNCLWDHRQIFNASLVTMSPGAGSGVVRRLTKDWELAPILYMSTGAPLNLTAGTDQSKTGQNLDRPNQVLNDPYPANRTLPIWFNPNAFALQPVGTFGNLGRNALAGPGSIQFDMALSRTLQLRDKIGLDFRVEAFNVINHANWNPPQTSLSSQQFGQITTFGSPRIVQLALKLKF